jgi:hypothetical protein
MWVFCERGKNLILGTWKLFGLMETSLMAKSKRWMTRWHGEFSEISNTIK